MSPTIELNGIPSHLLKAFQEEGLKCIKSSDVDVEFEVLIAFHGTSEQNIASILSSGLNPALRNGQSYGRGEYFAVNPALPYSYCKGGSKMLVFALITSRLDVKGQGKDIVVVERGQRQIPIATLTFDAHAMKSNTALLQQAANFQSRVNVLIAQKNAAECVLKEARWKEKIIKSLLVREYDTASHIYKKACTANSGVPPKSIADEIAMYIRDHIRDEDLVEIYFPNLPARPADSSQVMILNSDKCETDVEVAKQRLSQSLDSSSTQT